MDDSLIQHMKSHRLGPSTQTNGDFIAIPDLVPMPVLHISLLPVPHILAIISTSFLPVAPWSCVLFAILYPNPTPHVPLRARSRSLNRDPLPNFIITFISGLYSDAM